MSDNISMHRLNLSITIVNIIIHQLSKFSFSCVSLVENLSREIDEIKLSPTSAGEGNNALFTAGENCFELKIDLSYPSTFNFFFQN